jgi:alpha-L-rhamnosidase
MASPAPADPQPPSMQPWTAKWCWSRKFPARPWNSYVYFRRALHLRDRPRSATVRVTADARYTLYVNGTRIHFGPARCWPHSQSYDTLDLAPHLVAGNNSLCAVVHQFGIPTFQSVYRDASGFLLDGEVDAGGETIAIHTTDQWLCREARGWRKDVARLSIQLGFQEHFDAAADPADWMSPSFEAKPEDGWAAPHVIGPIGTHPWLAMEGRGSLPLAQHVEPFTAVLSQFSGENARGHKVAENVYALALQETRKREKTLLDNPQAMLKDDAAVTTVNPRPDGGFSMVVLDLGQTRTGHPILDIADAAGGEIVDLIYSEEVEKGGSPQLLGLPKVGICEESTGDRYRCRPGSQRWEPFHPKGMRYVSLIFRNVEKPLKVRHVAVRQVHAAVEDAGSFECSDAKLTRIWSVARETLRNCMLDTYIDCPWREQAQWWGDARVQFRVCAYAFGDVSMFERGIRQVAQSQAADGSLHAHPPSDMPQHRLPDYMMTWVGSLWDHYFHTGRTDLLRECLPFMHKLFDFFTAHEKRDHLVGGFDGFWVFLDWQALRKADFSGVLNLMYLQALRWAAAICQVTGDEQKGVEYLRKAQELAKTIEKTFWDAKAKVWRDGFDPATNALVEETSQHMAALAMLLRLRPESHPTLARDILLKPAQSKRGKILTASPFFYAYVLEALAESNFHAEVVQIIADKWGDMIDRGATTFWEVWDATTQSRCHAWSASPLYHLTQQVLGVMPVDVGWKQVRVAPVVMKLDFARGTVPSPLGPVRVEWERAGEDQLAVRVELPQGMTGEFVGPLGESRTLESGAQEFHT